MACDVEVWFRTLIEANEGPAGGNTGVRATRFGSRSSAVDACQTFCLPLWRLHDSIPPYRRLSPGLTTGSHCTRLASSDFHVFSEVAKLTIKDGIRIYLNLFHTGDSTGLEVHSQTMTYTSAGQGSSRS